MTIIDTVNDNELFRPLFTSLDSWRAWLVILKAIFALEMTDEERKVFKELSGRETAPDKPVEEAWIVAGRRGGKSRMAALIAVYLACFRDYSSVLAPGERITIMVLACDRRQARVLFRYALGLLEQVPMLQGMIERQDAESISLSNRVDLEITTNSFRSVRGPTIGVAILEEAAYWRSEYSANPDEEVLNAIRPAMATVPNALLVGIGSPYRRSGVLHDAWKSHYGKEGSSTLVIQASSQQLNPTIADSVIARAMEADPAAAQAEWFANFRNDLAAFLDMDLIEKAVEVGRRERGPLRRMEYVGFTDPSGGSHDAFTLAIGHRDGERIVLDVCRGIRPPFDPSQVVKEFCDVLKSYRLHSVCGDRYSGEWVVEAFAKHGVHYQHSDLTKSELYLESLPLFAQGVVDLLDYPPLLLELQQLERRTSRSGKDSVDHAVGSHDDLANSCCGVLALVAARTNQEAQMVPIKGWQ